MRVGRRTMGGQAASEYLAALVLVVLLAAMAFRAFRAAMGGTLRTLGFALSLPFP